MSQTLSGCPLCGGLVHVPLEWATAMTRPVFEGARVVRCDGCGLDHLDPRPATLAGVYEEGYFRPYQDAGMVFPTEASLHARFPDRLRAVAAMGVRGRLLEVGVGHGAFLRHAALHGWDVIGVEVSRYAAAYVKERHGIDVLCGPIETVDVPEGAFDMIHMSHVLEHLLDPVAALQRIRRLLSRRGVLALEVPNELENLHVRLRRASGLLRPYPVQCTHVCFFTAATLRRTLEAARFQVRSIRTLRDETDPKMWRRTMKHLGGAGEQLLDRGPLIEALAVAPDAGY
jgi:SAM-dependent methyltransferase